MTFWSALLLGLFASAHCGAMCGGVQQALQPQQLLCSKERLRWHNISLNVGRITTYIIAGALLGLGSVSLVNLVAADTLVSVFRTLTAIILLLIGCQLVFKKHAILSVFEPLGATVWTHVSKLKRSAPSDKLHRSYTSGLIWGLLPCGLLYSVLLTAALSGSVSNGALIMLGFGLGTLPALYLTGSAWMTLKRWFHTDTSQKAAGALFCIGGILVLFAPMIVDMSFAQNYPGLVSSVFCIR